MKGECGQQRGIFHSNSLIVLTKITIGMLIYETTVTGPKTQFKKTTNFLKCS